MKHNNISVPSPTKPMSRDMLVMLLKAALLAGERKYARRIALAWLTFYPGDLEISLLHAQALLQEENPLSLKQSLHILEDLCESDPEYVEAYHSLLQAKKVTGLNEYPESLGNEHVLRSERKKYPKNQINKLPKWASHLREARQILLNNNSSGKFAIKEAKENIHQALSINPDNLLVAVTHLTVMRQDESLSELGILSLANAYHNRWPKCVQFMLHLADLYMRSGDTDKAVALLHKAVTADITGNVAVRLWGENHPYKTMWPTNIEISETGLNTPQNIPIPAAVASILGWNQLPEVTSVDGLAGDRARNHNNLNSPDEPVRNPVLDSPDISMRENSNGKIRDKAITDTWNELVNLATKIKQPEIANMDGRFPVYVILSTKVGLVQKYGQENADLINAELKNLVTTIRGSRIGHRTWGSILFYPDDPDNITNFDIKPVPHNDPWGIKLTLADLEANLKKRGEMIGAILIVGCHEVVPFHHLPNPVDDDDVDVASDNPYATRDGNYFVQEWPVGRLPGDNSKEPGFLLKSVQSITGHYQELKHSRPWFNRLWAWILDIIWPPFRKIQPSLGYSAAVWRRASFSVFRIIGQPKSLFISPPTISCDSRQKSNGVKNDSEDTACISLTPTFLAYFNLHGLQDTAEWYGQSDPTDTNNYPDFPVALRPRDIVNGGRAPKVVFSEACYGAHITGKSLDEALALKFLASGSRCVIGSSCISYGSIRTPLIGADLLGHSFWKYLVDGFPVGEALRRAKIYLVNEMNKRQGYLDGEDQKTLISFILYGDPLAQPFDEYKQSNTLFRTLTTDAEIKTLCARVDNMVDSQSVPDEIMTNVKHIVSHYLPGMQDAYVSVGVERSGCQNACRNCLSGNLCPTAQSGHKNMPGKIPERKIITLSKSIHHAKYDHKQFARITLDPHGKVVKLAVSR